LTLASTFVLFAGLIFVAALTSIWARRTGIAHAIFLVVVGVGLGLVPNFPRVEISPEILLLLFLPPLLYSAGVGMSWRGFKGELSPILLLAVGCVLSTATAVAAAGHYLLGLPWAVGFVLGAVVSPPDAVAPMAIARQIAVPTRILTVLEGEGLINDATALVIFGFAVVAVQTGEFSLPAALGKFGLVAIGEVLWGVLIAWGTLHLRRWARDSQIEIVLALLTPYAAFWPPEMLGGSGVLAVVTAGLYVSKNGPNFISPATRLQGYFVWRLSIFLIESVVFLLVGLQARIILDELIESSHYRFLVAAVSITAVVVASRFVWIFSATYIPKLLPAWWGKKPSGTAWQDPFAIGFTGIRGVVSLVAAFSIPLQAHAGPFPDRSLLLFVTLFIILVTLVGQGLALPSVFKWLGIIEAGKIEEVEESRREVDARVSAIEAALRELNSVEEDGAMEESIAALRRRHEDRKDWFESTARRAKAGKTPPDLVKIQLKLVQAERDHIAKIYAREGIADATRRRIERELDLEYARVRHEEASGAKREEN
jgi:monovalent cation/hydrogen antiporter